MNPSSQDLERRWIEEVRYLHSLWRAGPPPNRTRNPNLRPLDAPELKKGKKRERGENNKDGKEECGENPWTNSGAEWPKNPSPPHVPPDATWEEAIAATAAPLMPSAEEIATLAAVRLQRCAAKACKEILAAKDEEMGGGDQDETERLGEEEAFLFFLGFFRKEEELRRYYEGSAEKGDFFCLVCLGVGEKLSRKYCSCVALVQHANSVTKTKTRDAHRAYGKAICRVMGWDFSRLPSIVLDMQGPLCPPAPPVSS
ncbi:hypothetical protein EJ110_NYTH31835 [Nymphaea thermarum]|nr:hypothetical protein EJ110_NYTH31835 [Nymphaea thermarum]